MPRKRSSGDDGLYQIRNKTLWRAVKDDGYWPDGRRKQISVTHKTQAGARAKLAEKWAEIQQFGAPIDKTSTVAIWSQEWLTTVCRPHMTPNGLKAYESIVRKWIVPTIGNRTVALVKPSDIRAVIKAISAAGLSSSTGLKAYNIMNLMFEAARLEGLAKKNVAADVLTPKAAVSTVTALSPEQARAILATADEDIDGSRWWVAMLAGLRQGERLGLRVDDLDLDTGVIRVDWSLTEITSEHGCGVQVAGKWPCGMTRGASCPSAGLKLPDGFEYLRLSGRLCLKRPKSGKARLVPVPPPIVTRLREYLATTADEFNPHGLVWHNAGAPIIPKDDEQEWRNLLLRAGQISAEQALEKRARPAGTPEPPKAHTARHTTATVLMELGVDVKIIGEIVGHQSEKVTRRYQHVSTPIAVEAMNRIGDHYTKALGS